MFGGVDHKGVVYNDLWLIEPHYEENTEILSKTSLDYFTRAKNQISIKTKKITNI